MGGEDFLCKQKTCSLRRGAGGGIERLTARLVDNEITKGVEGGEAEEGAEWGKGGEDAWFSPCYGGLEVRIGKDWRSCRGGGI